jgi:hypothetical protein
VNCDCKKRIEAQLLEKFKADSPEAADHAVQLEGYAFSISRDGGEVTQPMVTTFKRQALYGLKKGGMKMKTTKGFMHFSFCPFCGMKATK